VTVLFTLWQNSDGSLTFLQGSGPPVFADGSPQDGTHRLLWQVQAGSYNEAMRKYHEHMGWEPYQPMRDESGREYAEDNAPLD
jgi:hypothetical protein